MQLYYYGYSLLKIIYFLGREIIIKNMEITLNETLLKENKKLTVEFQKLKEIHQQEINDILNKTLLQINNNNPKLYL